MTTTEAIEQFDNLLYNLLKVVNGNVEIKLVQMLQLSLAALQEQEERENPKPLTLEELMNMDAPVWADNTDFPVADGFWCICHKGHIVCPSGQIYAADDLTSWVFYRYEPNGGDKPCSKSLTKQRVKSSRSTA